MRPNKKITLIISSLSGGGAEGICINIANNFSKNGWHVDLVVLNLKNEVFLDRISNEINLVILKVNHARYSFVPLLKYLYRHKIKSCLVFNHELAVVLVILRFIFRLNVKIISRNISILSIKIELFKNKGIWQKYFVRPFVTYFYKNIDHVVNQCKSMQDDLIRYYPKIRKNTSVIYNPISFQVNDYINKNDLTKIKKKTIYYVLGD